MISVAAGYLYFVIVVGVIGFLLGYCVGFYIGAKARWRSWMGKTSDEYFTEGKEKTNIKPITNEPPPSPPLPQKRYSSGLAT